MSRIDKIIAKAINTVMENMQSDIKDWHKDNIPCDKWYDENHLADLDEDALEIIQSDWVEYFIDYYTDLVCIELGTDTNCIVNKCHTEFVEEIYDRTKERLFEEVQAVTYKIIALQSIDFEQVKEDIEQVCDRLNNCKTLQDISDYARHDNNLGVITSINFYDVDYPDIEEAIENNVGKEKISFICFSQLGEVNHLVFHFKDGKTNIDSVEFDIYDKEDKRICLQEMMLSNFIDNDKEDYER